MHKRDFLIVLALTILLCFSQHVTKAQSDVPRFEVGGHFTALHYKDLDILGRRMNYGFGGRFTYNISDNLAVEAEGNLLPRDIYDNRRVQGLFGAKLGFRRGRFGFFGKARPGFVRVTRLEVSSTCLAIGCPPTPPPRIASRADFAIDLGGVVEFYPSRRVVTRVDFGDTIIRLRYAGPPPITRHNFQISAGIGFRF